MRLLEENTPLVAPRGFCTALPTGQWAPGSCRRFVHPRDFERRVQLFLCYTVKTNARLVCYRRLTGYLGGPSRSLDKRQLRPVPVDSKVCLIFSVAPCGDSLVIKLQPLQQGRGYILFCRRKRDTSAPLVWRVAQDEELPFACKSIGRSGATDFPILPF